MCLISMFDVLSLSIIHCSLSIIHCPLFIVNFEKISTEKYQVHSLYTSYLCKGKQC